MKNIDIVKIICKELGKPESLITHVTDRKGHDMRYAIDPTKIHNELGWLPETKFEDGIENFMLFVPFSILLLWAFQKELLDESENIRFGKTVWEATKVVAVFSFLIEFTQLLFHLGTFQISDLTYNTLGGAVGGVIYYLGYSRKRKK